MTSSRSNPGRTARSAARSPSPPLSARLLFATIIVAMAVVLAAENTRAQTNEDARLAAAGAVLYELSANPDQSIPAELLQRAHGIAVIPGVVRGGFIVGGRRGRGVLVVRSDDGRWSNPAFVTITSGSIGWQVGAQSADLVLVFANERSVTNIASGRFTLGGDASVVAGPIGRHATAAATFRAEVYAYQLSRGLFAGAAFEGVRLNIDTDSAARYYAGDANTWPLGPRSRATPESAVRFLQTLEGAEGPPELPVRNGQPRSRPAGEAVTFPLGD